MVTSATGMSTGGSPVATPRRLAASAVTPLDALATAELEAMYAAAADLLECQRVLANTGDNVVTEALRGEQAFEPWSHYPRGDVFDPRSQSQFYYHTHVAEERVDGEHGHFHTFLRPAGVGLDVAPVPLDDFVEPGNPGELVAHLAGISVDAHGQVFRLFTTNRWVTAETWYPATAVEAMLEHFRVDHARPSWPLNRWVSAVVTLFRPQIRALVRARDERVAEYAAAHPGRNVHEDRGLNVTSEMRVSVAEQVQGLEATLAEKRSMQ